MMAKARQDEGVSLPRPPFGHLKTERQLRQEILDRAVDLKQWFKEMELQMLPLKFDTQWTKKQISDKMKTMKAFHSDIASRGPAINCLVQLCDDYTQRYLIDLGRQGKRGRGGAHGKVPSSLVCQSKLPSFGDIIKKRWHRLWIRSLESQCFLEQLSRLNRTRKKQSVELLQPAGQDSSVPADSNPWSASPSPRLRPPSPKCIAQSSPSHQNSTDLQPEAKMNSSYSSESASSLMADSLTSGATTSSCGDLVIEELDQDEQCWSERKKPRPVSMIEPLSTPSNCMTTFSRTSSSSGKRPGGSFPNCGTYFFRHMSDGEEEANGNGRLIREDNLLFKDLHHHNRHGPLDDSVILRDHQLADCSTQQSNAHRQSIEQLVNGAEQIIATRLVRSTSYTKSRPPANKNELLMEDGHMPEHKASIKVSSLVDNLMVRSPLSPEPSQLASEHEAEEDEDYYEEDDEDEEEDDDDDEEEDVVDEHMEYRGQVKHNATQVDDDDLNGEVKHLDEQRSLLSPQSQDADGANEDEELSEFWDQEKYLSEHNYEEQIDEDTTLKLLNFGDDYRKFIDSMSEADISDGGPLSATLPMTAKTRSKRRIRRSTTARDAGHYDSLSESEWDDSWKVALESRTKLNEVKQRLRNLDDDEDKVDLTSTRQDQEQLDALKDLCFENVQCILKLLDQSDHESSLTLKKTKRSFKGLLRQWQEVLHVIVNKLQLAEQLSNLMGQMDGMQRSISQFSCADGQPITKPAASSQIHTKSDLERGIQDLKSSLGYLTQLKTELFNINLEMHDFLANWYSTGRKHPLLNQRSSLSGKESPTSTSLKDRAVGLYSLWDETYHRISLQLATSESTFDKLLEFETERERLQKLKGLAAKCDLKTSSTNTPTQIRRLRKKNSLCLTEDSGISESGDNDNEETILIKLRLLAQDLEQKLPPDCSLMMEIAQSLKNSESDAEPKSTVTESNGSVWSTKKSKKRRHRPTAAAVTSSEKATCTTDDEKEMLASSRPAITPAKSLLRRAMKASMPLQVMFMAALFAAWTWRPQCCEAINNYMSFWPPQLTSSEGTPPI